VVDEGSMKGLYNQNIDPRKGVRKMESLILGFVLVATACGAMAISVYYIVHADL